MTSAEVKHEVTYDLDIEEQNDEKRIWKSCWQTSPETNLCSPFAREEFAA